ncbi:paraquat-inducible protein A [Granulosicoccus sp. 3-233]|uniref:paraquat-inducible protein A n=1 Tax=Granulosicoccus sp. 3-233 TaxID=3417969 RepID=UPI003D33026A
MKISFGILLLIAAYFLLLPGLTQPMLSVSGTVEKTRLVEVGKDLIKDSPNTPSLVNNLVDMVVEGLDVRGTVDAFDKTRSILETAQELYAGGHLPVAILIVVFSVIVPLIKALLLLAMLLPVSVSVRSGLLSFSNAISKWSMADVFVIAIFIAFLAANGMQESRALVDFQASLGVGFWYFLAYCLLSILGTQVLSAGLKARFQHEQQTASARLDRDASRLDESPSAGTTADASRS